MKPSITQDKYLSSIVLLAIFFTGFVIYGSLIPFESRGYTFDQAVNLFSGITYLELGTSSRADLIANALIYIPVGFFWSRVVAEKALEPWLRLSWLVIIILSLSAMAFLIEFLQVFVSPRTVSRNDLAAEIIGIISGSVLSVMWGGRFKATLTRALAVRQLPIKQIFLLYLSAYLLFSLFPYDFYISLEELQVGWQSMKLSFWGNPGEGRGIVSSLLFRVAEFCVALPLGYLYKRTTPDQLSNIKLLAASTLAFFIAIDLLQFIMASGSVAFVGLFTRTAGALTGWYFARKIGPIRFTLSRKALFLFGALAFVPYLAGIMVIKGWSLPLHFSLTQAGEILESTVFLPFYYHYFATELRAFTSLLVQVVILFPVGVSLYALDRIKPGTPDRSAVVLLLTGALIAFFIEASGLAFNSLRPDPSNIIIGAAAVFLGYVVSDLLYNSLTQATQQQPPSVVSAPAIVRHSDSTAHSKKRKDNAPKNSFSLSGAEQVAHKIIAIATIFACFLYALDYPLSRTVLLLGSVIYLLALYRWNSCWLLVVPICIPLADLYVLSGRYFMTELDYIILLTLAFKYFTGQAAFPRLSTDKVFFSIIAGLILCYFGSMWQVLYPWPTVDENSFYSIYSPFNGLRISKSLLWALLLYPALHFESRHNHNWFNQFATGMSFGLISLCIVVLLERALFSGIFNFSSSEYRVKGSFASMHTGGGHIDTYLMMTLPFLAWLFFQPANLGRMVLNLVFILLSGYTIFVTYSRGPYIVTPVLILIFIVGIFIVSKERKISFLKNNLWLPGILFLGFWVSVPFIYDTVLSDRLELVEQDKDIRVSHWHHSANLVGAYGGSRFWGNGPGSFSNQFYIDRNASGQQTAVHQLASESGNTFLRISGGNNIYTSQYIGLELDQTYLLSFDARHSNPKSSVTMPICEMWIMDSFRCIWTSQKLSDTADWSSYTVEVKTDNLKASLGKTDAIMRRPVVFSLYTSRSQEHIDIDNLKLLDNDGKNILANGDFEHGKDHWYFSADNHLLWHTKNIIVNLYHDFGIAGLSCILALTFLSVMRNLNMVYSGSKAAISLLGSILGFAGIGIVCSIFDVPQLSLLFFLVLLASQLLWLDINRSPLPIIDPQAT